MAFVYARFMMVGFDLSGFLVILVNKACHLSDIPKSFGTCPYLYIYSRSVPGEYYCTLDASGRRCDLDQRPELCKGSVEFVASTEYMVRPPMPPLYFFLIDVSVPAVHSGLLEVISKFVETFLIIQNSFQI